MIFIMKRLLIVTLLFILQGCRSQNSLSPSQNTTLNKVTKSTEAKQKEGWMQKHLDDWLKNKWEKNTASFEENALNKKPQQEQNLSNSKKRGWLQYYVDKISYYNKHTKKSNSSHAKKLEKMPVIGKK